MGRDQGCAPPLGIISEENPKKIEMESDESKQKSEEIKKKN